MDNFFKKLKQVTDRVYDNIWIGGKTKKEYVLEAHKRTECNILKKFVKTTNNDKKYDRTLYYEEQHKNELTCSIYFNTS